MTECVNQAAVRLKPGDVGLDDPASENKLKSCCRVATVNDFHLPAVARANELKMHLQRAVRRKF